MRDRLAASDRVQLHINNGKKKAYIRNGLDWIKRFPVGRSAGPKSASEVANSDGSPGQQHRGAKRDQRKSRPIRLDPLNRRQVFQVPGCHWVASEAAFDHLIGLAKLAETPSGARRRKQGSHQAI